MAIRVLAVGNNNTTQEDHRRLIAALTATAGTSSHRAGLFPSSGSAPITNISAMVAGVGGFKAVVPNPAGGSYLVQSDATINVTFDPGEAGVARSDRIIVKVYNSSQDASGRDDAAVEYLKGQSSGSATAVPANAILLYEIPVPAGASAGGGGINFTSLAIDKRFYTATAGGVIPVTDNTGISDIVNPYDGMPAYNKSLAGLFVNDGSSFKLKSQIAVASYANLGGIPNPWEGLIAYVKDTDLIYAYDGAAWKVKSQISAASLTALNAISGVPNGAIGIANDTKFKYVYNGTTWVRDPIIKAGTGVVTSGPSFGSVSFGYTFPSAPIVNVTANSGAGSQIGPEIMVTNVTTTGFSCRIDINTGSSSESIGIFWTAIVP